MTKRVDRLEDLAEVIRVGKPTKVSLDLGEQGKGTGLTITRTDGGGVKGYSARIDLSPVFTLSGDYGEVMNITDSDGQTLKDYDDSTGRIVEVTDSGGTVVQDAYRNMELDRPSSVVYEPPIAQDEHDLGTLIVDLKDKAKLAFSHTKRETYV